MSRSTGKYKDPDTVMEFLQYECLKQEVLSCIEDAMNLAANASLAELKSMCHGRTIDTPKCCQKTFVRLLKRLKKRVEMTTNEVHGRKEFQKDMHHLKLVAMKIVKAGIAGASSVEFKCTDDELALM